MKSKVTIWGGGRKNEQEGKAFQGLEDLTVTGTYFEMGPEKSGQKRMGIRLFLKAAPVLGQTREEGWRGGTG